MGRPVTDNIIPFRPRPDRIARIEIAGGIQSEPMAWTGADGTRLDYSNVGGMVYWAVLIHEGGAEEILCIDESVRTVARHAGQAALEHQVPVVDRTEEVQ